MLNAQTMSLWPPLYSSLYAVCKSRTLYPCSVASLLLPCSYFSLSVALVVEPICWQTPLRNIHIIFIKRSLEFITYYIHALLYQPFTFRDCVFPLSILRTFFSFQFKVAESGSWEKYIINHGQLFSA